MFILTFGLLLLGSHLGLVFLLFSEVICYACGAAWPCRFKGQIHHIKQMLNPITFVEISSRGHKRSPSSHQNQTPVLLDKGCQYEDTVTCAARNWLFARIKCNTLGKGGRSSSVRTCVYCICNCNNVSVTAWGHENTNITHGSLSITIIISR